MVVTNKNNVFWKKNEILHLNIFLCRVIKIYVKLNNNK